MFRAMTGALLPLTMVLAGCSSLGCGDPHPYLNSPTRPPLKAPEGMSIPAPDPAFAVSRVTPASGQSNERDAVGVCLINPPRVLPLANSGKPAAEVTPTGSHTPTPSKSADQNQTPAPASASKPSPSQSLAVTGRLQ